MSDEVLLKVSNLKKNFGDIEALRGVDLDVKKGEVVVILGPSGCGKSTFLRCLNGLEERSNGSIYLEGYGEIGKEIPFEKIRGTVGMVFQSYELFPHLNVINNIMLGPIKAQNRKKEEVEKQADELLNRVGLYNRKFAYPRELSGGQKQRIAIVRALCMNPEIMLFDEVTAALDPEMVREVLLALLELARNGMTMIIVTHELEFAKHVADKIVFMEDGKIVEVSSPKEFFENPKTERAKSFLASFDLYE
ncbi:amino acid ABC transporter ATP-binding protein [uncultured Clostridium sp.]|uniref:amino acid ABC transporter ATP-binding protein n=1 Tax=uncultured Clostridium sp. TaxID=59620 RepID=UPI002589E629|nr:amino acid ABC transporter ATP-binding protein [uncultured Clostridium sp.]